MDGGRPRTWGGWAVAEVTWGAPSSTTPIRCLASASTKIDAVTHRLLGNHPNAFNQGVTDEPRRSDRGLHWWYRSQEMGGRDVLGEGYYYD